MSPYSIEGVGWEDDGGVERGIGVRPLVFVSSFYRGGRVGVGHDCGGIWRGKRKKAFDDGSLWRIKNDE